MLRTLFFWCAGIAVFTHTCLAEQTITTTEMLIRLNVRPAPAPKPALRYRLLPELKEMNPGNPIQSYMNCMMAAEEILSSTIWKSFQNREKLLAVPLDRAARAKAAGGRPVRSPSRG